LKLIKKIIGDTMGIKAAGGIRTLKQVINMLEAGATRIGTSSGVKIIRELSKG
jgi:deoxyribose-phosphate aldolase